MCNFVLEYVRLNNSHDTVPSTQNNLNLLSNILSV
jgi:hypothetical protein